MRWARCIGADTKLARRLRSVTWPRAALLGGLVATVVVVYAAFFKASRYPPATTAKSVNSFTYDYYVHGKVKVSSERREESDQAIKLLEWAVAADWNFAPAYAELARAYNIKAFYLTSEEERKKLTEEAEVNLLEIVRHLS